MAALEHGPPEALAQMHRGIEVHGHHLGELVQREVLEGMAQVDPGIVDQDVHLVLGQDLADRLFAGGAVGEIHREAAVALADGLGAALQADHAGPGGEQPLGDGAADAAGGAGDHGHRAGEIDLEGRAGCHRLPFWGVVGRASPCSVDVRAAVDVEGDAGEVAAVAAQQVVDGSGDVVDRADAAHGQLLQ